MKRAHIVAATTAFLTASAATQERLFVIDGDSGGDSLGMAAARLPDIDADGHPDFLIAARGQRGTCAEFEGTGFLQVRSGKDGSLIRTRTLTEKLCAGRPVVASLGDLDNDGVGDYGGVFRNRLMAFSGRTGGRMVYRVGYTTLCAAGDIDQDSHSDILAGDQSSGLVHILSGRDGSTLREVKSALRGFAAAVAGLGDIDLDRVPDFAVSALETHPRAGPGTVVLTQARPALSFGRWSPERRLAMASGHRSSHRAT